MDKLWLAHKSNKRTPLGFRSFPVTSLPDTLLLPITRLQVSKFENTVNEIVYLVGVRLSRLGQQSCGGVNVADSGGGASEFIYSAQ